MPFPVARVLGPLLVLGEPEPAWGSRAASDARRWRCAAYSRVEGLGWVCSQCPGASTRAMSRARSGEVSVTDVELVMLRRGAAGRRWFRRVPLDVNGTPDGRYAGRRGAAVARGGCASRGDEVCSRELVWQTMILPVNSFLIADWSSGRIRCRVSRTR